MILFLIAGGSVYSPCSRPGHHGGTSEAGPGIPVARLREVQGRELPLVDVSVLPGILRSVHSLCANLDEGSLNGPLVGAADVGLHLLHGARGGGPYAKPPVKR
ncbi:hypothetical protein OG735_20135 [Streptomyces sp. NBC_01210]|uniref:hypothetical protein n=1 Tax=Streptomyces sp. NBC_01210 TaxID=2903774 RepID=UPI002E0EFC95|nr:hypothetical protein OG735_20135 [Streptomyces sp. NBC_01210]